MQLSAEDQHYVQSATMTPDFGGTMAGGAHWLPVRVYYEDTDAEGIVYYANYLRFLERGRTELLHKADLTSSADLMARGFGYVVRRVELDYLRPAHVDDLLVVKTWIAQVRGASMVMSQLVFRAEALLVQADVRIACLNLNGDGRPTRLPTDLREFYEKYMALGSAQA